MKKQKPGNEHPLDMEFAEDMGVNLEFQGTGVEEEYNWEEKELKHKYNKTLIRLIARDPGCLYTYWEITSDEFYQNQPVLRLFKESEGTHTDININYETSNWYIPHVMANQTYKIAIGYKKNDIFYPLTFSNSVTTPPDRPSSIIDESWLCIEELSKYSYKIDINSTLSLMQSLEKRRELAQKNIDSYTFNHHFQDNNNN